MEENEISEVQTIQQKTKFFCIILYAANHGKERVSLRNDLKTQKALTDGFPSALLGDFNVTLFPHEYSVGGSSISKDMQEFRKSKPFRFANYVADKPEFLQKVNDEWQEEINGFKMFQVVKKLKSMKKEMNKFNWQNGNIFDKVAIDDINDIFTSTLNEEEANTMIQDVTNAKIKNDMFDTVDVKAPGPDGYTTQSKVDFSQSAFIPERHIQDNILVTQELLRGYNRKNGVKRCALKIDLQKAYDTFNWTFMESIMQKFGFHPKMVKFIMTCITTSSFSIYVHGTSYGYIKGARGLRQGDPISLYLFKLVIESARIVKETIEELIGKLPIKYIGVPLLAKCLGIADCKVLIDKVKVKNIIAKKNTLWDQWVNKVKLKGRNILGSQCGQKKQLELELRDKMKPHVNFEIGDGKTTSVWYDLWIGQEALANFISKRDIYDARFYNNSKVANMIKDGE
ncbi:RNA-directed DNA polymerase, eukaryota, reverse transcriptase zinc-binding domain protein [Tanacetum coccineum]